MGATEATPSWRPPNAFEEYRLVQILGQGAMGQVHLARDVLLDRAVAVKFISAVRPDETSRRRFYLEARAIARVQHPNVVAVYRAGEVDGRPYLVAELVRGTTLADVPKPVPRERVIQIGLGLARGLAAAHREGVLHRDVKPANIMLTDTDEVKLVDFGLAKLLEETRSDPVASHSGAATVRGRAALPSDRVDDGGDLTGFGGLVGTPLYMAPEVVCGEAATRRSDVYSAGVVLFELCRGQAPRALLPRGVSREEWIAAPPSFDSTAVEIEPRLAAIILRCLLPDPVGRYASADELREDLERLAPDLASAEVPEGNPYRGLASFEAEHRAVFFGRAGEVKTVIERMRNEALILVAGDSGVGKSSLCRAGVLPRVVEGALGDGRTFTAVTLVPGRYPLGALAAAIAPILEVGAEALLERMRGEPGALGRDLARALGPARGLLVFVDQLEELCTSSDPGEAAAFDAVVAKLDGVSPGLRVLATVRGDFLTRIAALPGLGAGLPRTLYLLRPLSAEAMRSAIAGPAQRTGVTFESEELIDDLVASSLRAPGGLPLLQFAMAELWETRDRETNRIEEQAVEAIGGVGGALARHADGVLAGLRDHERPAARRVLLRLVTHEGTRARRSATELDADEPATRAALEALIRGRLVVARASGAETVYEVAHEALLRGWGTLRRWRDADAERQKVRERVASATAEWVRLGEARDALWSDRRLIEAAVLDASELSGREGDFLAASRRQGRARRIRRWAGVLAAPLAIAIALVGIRLKARHDLDELVAGHVQKARASVVEGRTRKAEAEELRRRALGLFDGVIGRVGVDPKPELDEAERLWASARSASTRAEISFVNALKSFEAGFALDPANSIIRGSIADVEVDRIVLAETFYEKGRREDSQRMLESFDPDGARRLRLAAPPVLAIKTVPSGAGVSLQRYESTNGRRVLSAPRALGSSPIAGATLQEGPGSYLITLSMAGRTPVRLPVLLGSAETFTAAIDLPDAASVPEGYVYIPPGRFLVGSGDAEDFRKGLLRAVPLHEARTRGYLISRTEVTFSEWISYLNDLPSAEAAVRTPRSDAPQGEIALTRLSGGGWQLAVGPEGPNRSSAPEGKPLELKARTLRRVQNWANLPVAAVTWTDAVAYAAWLDRTGRVRGARLCDELEWERAARGADDRVFPHGDRLEPDDANFDETYGQQPLTFGLDEVGAHPISASPFGLVDMTGNVQEWTRALYGSTEVQNRGGAFYYDRPTAWIPNKSFAEANTRDMTTGVRICADYPAR